MAQSEQSPRGGRPEPLSRMVGKVLDPICAQRGLSQAALLSNWAEIIGPRYADWTQPERIIWPRRRDGTEPPGGTLVLRVDGGRAVYLQHELEQVIDRINQFLGFQAVARVRLVQAPVTRPAPPTAPADPKLSAEQSAELDLRLTGIESPDLRSSLKTLGAAVLGQAATGKGEETP